MIEQITGLPEPVLTGLILVLLVGALIVAFKVMEMIFDTITIATLSGALYLGLTYMTEAPFQLNDLLLFSFLGASVYMLYSFLSTLISTTSTAIKIPLTIILGIYRPLKSGLKSGYRHIKLKIRDMREEEIQEEKDRSTKEVVLNSD
ncbi:MAG: hypothetical protein ACLFTA_01650 [Candidatus Nanohaloarchaea archaeon]